MFKSRMLTYVAAFFLLFSSTVFANSTWNKVGQDFSDTGITTAVMAKYVADTSLNIFKINVETAHGIVFLSGTVDNQVQYNQAIRLARSVDGVKGVDYTKLRMRLIK